MSISAQGAHYETSEIKILLTKFQLYFTCILYRTICLGYSSTWNESKRTHVVTRTRGHVPGGSVGCVRAWGLRNGIGTVVLTKIGHACAFGEGWKTVRRPCRFLERSILGHGVRAALSNAHSPRSCPPFLARSSRGIRPIPRSAISSLLSSARDRGRNRRGESTKATVKSSRVDGSRYIVEACAPAISRRGGVCRWKFYQYLGGHLVSLRQSFAKSYAPNADRGLTPSRPINRRRGLPE